MNKSNSIGALAKALAAFHLKVGKIKKDATNPFFKSKYASLSNILDAITIPLAESGLTFTQFPAEENGLITILMHESGEFIESTYSMRPVKDDPQGRGSAITYQRRYALAAILGLNIDEDDDGNAATQPPATPQKKQQSYQNKVASEMILKELFDCKSSREVVELYGKYKETVSNSDVLKTEFKMVSDNFKNQLTK